MMHTLKLFISSVLLIVIGLSFTNCKKEEPKEDPGTSTPQEPIFTDARDQKVYHWVKINKQIWMVENLAYLPSVSSSKKGSEDDGEEDKAFYYVYGYDGIDTDSAKKTDHYKSIGVLYNWKALETAAPEGWHIPSDQELTELQQYLGIDTEAGSILKEKGTEYWLAPNKDAVNSVGFSALSSGYRSTYGNNFQEIRESAYFWTSTEEDSYYAWYKKLNNENGEFKSARISKNNACAVRCIKNY